MTPIEPHAVIAALDFEFLFRPLESFDAWLTGLFDGAPLLVALGIALALGLRHASDPDHLVAVTSLVAAEDRGPRDAHPPGRLVGPRTRDHPGAARAAR